MRSRRAPTFALMLALAALVLLPAPRALAVPDTGAGLLSGIPITGALAGAPGRVGRFAGSLDIGRFEARGGRLVALGTLSGRLVSGRGEEIGAVRDLPVALPVGGLSGTCRRLHLELGPVDAVPVGAPVRLDRVVHEISTPAEADTLLARLVCRIGIRLADGAAPIDVVAPLNELAGLFG